MEVKKEPASIHAYWPRYWRRMVVFIFSMQLIGVGIVIAALLVSGIFSVDDIGIWVGVVSILLAMIGVNIIILPIATEPLKQLTAALAQVAGEESDLLPPNPNVSRYAKSGLQPLLQSIYELSAKSKETPVKSVKPTRLTEDTFSHLSTGLVVFDKQKELIYANDAAPIKTEPDGSKHLDLLFYTDTTFDAWLEDCEANAVHAEKTWQRIATKPTGEDGRKIYDITASYEKGSQAPVVVVLVEKTKEYEPEDNELNFIAFAAHELRGPITVIRGYLDSLNDELADTISQDQKELFERLIVSSNRLSSYINNILNASRYDRRHLSVHLTETTVANMYDVIADDMQLRASAQQRLLSIEIPRDLPTVAADPASIGEVLGNLIDNGIKYSNEGGVVNVSAHQKDDTTIEVSVEDHGIGMPANVIGNLFHKFYRSHRSRETVAGTGIGLYITKAMIESHGGEVGVRSVEGQGSTFTFTLPTYASVADKLAASGGDNSALITHHSAGWIRNHGVIRG